VGVKLSNSVIEKLEWRLHGLMQSDSRLLGVTSTAAANWHQNIHIEVSVMY